MNNTEAEVFFYELVKDSRLLKALEAAGFKTATAVQALAVPAALNGSDLVVEAKTGSGKTLAFVIPMLEALYKSKAANKKGQTFSLVIAPTRELAQQIAEVIDRLDSSVAPVLVIGGASYARQRSALKRDSRIVIGTPGRILDMLGNGDLVLDHVRFFVLDEADEMFSMGFIKDVQDILSDIPKEAQGMFVSATISGRVLSLAGRYLNDYKHIRASEIDQAPPDIEHLYCNVGGEVSDKPRALCDIVEYLNPESVIIFCNTKSETELVEKFLRRRGFDARRINSDLTQSERTRVMTKIRERELRILVATDIAARGIDIEQIEMVINFSVHEQAEIYVHRTGRTGRAGRSGRAITLVSPHDFMAFRNLKSLDIELKEFELPSEDELAVARLKHLRESLSGEVREKDLALASRALKHIGGIDNPEPELTEFLGRLLHFTTEHLVNVEAQSLEEELRAESSGSKQGDRQHKKRHSRKGHTSGRTGSRGSKGRRKN
ncbi:MAG: DEAD/DEAH box helicase [Candidatus Dadabacteria bacterium]|nr:MAG: DEAD/DEAH box helicase [Candidatus Dadabacteria bacterium]